MDNKCPYGSYCDEAFCRCVFCERNRLKSLVREMGEELEEVKHALDYAMQYGYQSGLHCRGSYRLRNDIEVTINRPEVRAIIWEE